MFSGPLGAGIRLSGTADSAWAVLVAGSLLFCCAVLRAQDPTPPTVGLTTRCYYPGTVVVRWPADSGDNVRLKRTGPDGRTVQIGALADALCMFYDTEVQPGVVYHYRLVCATGRELGPVPGASSAEMLTGGDFEDLPEGVLTSTTAFHKAYGPPWWEVIAGCRPEGSGAGCMRVRHGSPPRRDGLHSRLMPVDPTSVIRQSGWVRTVGMPGGSVGRQLLTAQMKPAGGRIVAYSYAPDVREEPGGWRYVEARLASMPGDTEYIQCWALAYNAPVDVVFDDLSLIDERTERLEGFDAEAQLADLVQLAARAGDAQLREQAGRLQALVRELQTALAAPSGTPLPDYLAQVEKLDDVVREVTDLTWDLRMLSLAK